VTLFFKNTPIRCDFLKTVRSRESLSVDRDSVLVGLIILYQRLIFNYQRSTYRSNLCMYINSL